MVSRPQRSADDLLGERRGKNLRWQNLRADKGCRKWCGQVWVGGDTVMGVGSEFKAGIAKFTVAY